MKGIMRICSYYFIVDISLHIVPFVPDKFLNYNRSITFYPVLMLKKKMLHLMKSKWSEGISESIIQLLVHVYWPKYL